MCVCVCARARARAPHDQNSAVAGWLVELLGKRQSTCVCLFVCSKQLFIWRHPSIHDVQPLGILLQKGRSRGPITACNQPAACMHAGFCFACLICKKEICWLRHCISCSQMKNGEVLQRIPFAVAGFSIQMKPHVLTCKMHMHVHVAILICTGSVVWFHNS